MLIEPIYIYIRLLLLLHKYLNNSLSQTWYARWPSGLRLSLT